MNKKVKYLGAAAAALLTVAPIATPVVTSVANTVSAATTTPIALTLTAPARTVAVSEKPSTYTTPASFQVSTNVGTVAGISAVTLKTQGGTATTDETGFTAGWTYNQTATVALSGLKAGQVYTINGTSYTANAEGVITGVSVTAKITAVDATQAGQPFFAYNATGKTVYGDVVLPTVAGKVEAGKVLVDDNTVTAVNAQVQYVLDQISAFRSSENTDNANVTYNVASDLAAQGITVSNGKFTADTFYVTLTATNPVNGKTATVRVPFKSTKADATLPVFVATTNNGKETLTNGQTSTGVIKVKNGANFTAADAADYVVALSSGTNNAQIRFSVANNPVNTKVAGDYKVTYTATNSNGKTASASVIVRVAAAVETPWEDATINYVPGYSVNEYAVAGSNYTTWLGRLGHGTAVRAWDTTTVNGVSYTRVTTTDKEPNVNTLDEAKQVNKWVQTKYLSTYTGDNGSSTSTGETLVSGVATVNYKGAGKVALRYANGLATGKQYVANGTSWKVFAKKTVNGKVLYRLGSQSQWIEAQYVTFR